MSVEAGAGILARFRALAGEADPDLLEGALLVSTLVDADEDLDAARRAVREASERVRALGGNIEALRTVLFQELGLKDFELTGWFGIVAPKATPPDIIAKLSAAVIAALKDPEVARRIRTVGMEPTPTTPEGLSAYLEGDIAKAAKVAPVDDKPN